MSNIQFNYLYRDSTNYKKFNFVIFANPNNFELEEIEILIRSKLIGGKWFYTEDWGLPAILGDSFDFKIDPTWHEFESIEHNDELVNDPLTIEGFLTRIKSIKTEH